jgi:hypothetical protein
MEAKDVIKKGSFRKGQEGLYFSLTQSHSLLSPSQNFPFMLSNILFICFMNDLIFLKIGSDRAV